jgi:hypothetical protein
MADGKLEKMEKDWSAEVSVGISKSSELVKVPLNLRTRLFIRCIGKETHPSS